MSVIAPLAPLGNSVDAAWDRYSVLARRLADDPALAANPEYLVSLARHWNEWQRLFLQAESAA